MTKYSLVLRVEQIEMTRDSHKATIIKEKSIQFDTKEPAVKAFHEWKVGPDALFEALEELLELYLANTCQGSDRPSFRIIENAKHALAQAKGSPS